MTEKNTPPMLFVGQAPDRTPAAQWLMTMLFPEIVADEADAAADAMEAIQWAQDKGMTR